MNSLNCKKDYTQSELAAMYEYQHSREGRTEMAAKEHFMQQIKERLGLPLQVEEVGIITNLTTGEKQYFITKKG